MSAESSLLFQVPERYRRAVSTLSVFVVWLTYGSVMIGMASGYTDWFMTKTPWNQLLCFLLLVLNFPINTRPLAICFVVCFAIGFCAELIGVNTGLLFGVYHYLPNFGPGMGGVPYLIGTNWAVLGFIAFGVSATLKLTARSRMVIAALLMVALDALMEPVAAQFGFWQFAGNEVPIWNYVCWFLVALPMQYLLLRVKPVINNRFCMHLLSANFIFFLWSNVVHQS